MAIIDDHRLLRFAIESMLRQAPDKELVGAFENSAQYFNKTAILMPHVVLCDISLEDENGLDIVKSIKQLTPQVGVIMISTHKDALYINLAIEAGANGYLHKNDSLEEVNTAIDQVAAGKAFFSKCIKAILDEHESSRPTSAGRGLTTREKEIVRLILEGLTSKDIAKQKGLSVRTIEAHRYNILSKLNLKTTADLFHIKWDGYY